jgi:hypothetical protein
VLKFPADSSPDIEINTDGLLRVFSHLWLRVGYRISPTKVLFIIGLRGKKVEGHGVGVI